jgi:hypothetical protein
MRKVKNRRFGKSLGIVLPSDVLSRMRTSEGEHLLLIEAPEHGYQLSPYDVTFERKLEKSDKIFSRYRGGLRALK